VIGENSGIPWIVGVKNPTGSGIIGTLSLSVDDSVATSGAYERFREYNGRRYHHIIDPKRGYPADSGLISVSVICSDPILADAYATAFFVMGLKITSKFLAENSGISVILVDDKEKIFVSRKLEGKVEFKNEYSVHYF
jgi:thiamine biosynthesis lipoprotein